MSNEEFMMRFAADNPDLIDSIHDWIAEGWGLKGDPTPEQMAAALFMEATTQDKCVRAGESDPSYPVRLRLLARSITDQFHPV